MNGYQGGVCWCQLFYIASMALGCFMGYTFTDLYVENYARFLQESNLTLAETQVKFQETRDLDFNFLYVVLVLFGIFAVVLLLFCLPCFSRGIADYYILLLGKMAGMWRAHHKIIGYGKGQLISKAKSKLFI